MRILYNIHFVHRFPTFSVCVCAFGVRRSAFAMSDARCNKHEWNWRHIIFIFIIMFLHCIQQFHRIYTLVCIAYGYDDGVPYIYRFVELEYRIKNTKINSSRGRVPKKSNKLCEAQSFARKKNVCAKELNLYNLMVMAYGYVNELWSQWPH